MKKHLSIFATAAILLSLWGCEDVSNKMTDSYPTDYDVKYGIRQVMQYDPMNVNGIDVGSKFDFFPTFRFTIHYTEGRISAVTFSNGEVPFSPYDFAVPAGKADAYFDTKALPNALRLKESGKVIAYFQNGEFSIPFQLDCASVEYKYTFKSVE